MRIKRCDSCKQVEWVNACTLGGHFLGEFCAGCFEDVVHDSPDRNPWAVGCGGNNNDPGFDNVIRAFEEDR